MKTLLIQISVFLCFVAIAVGTVAVGSAHAAVTFSVPTGQSSGYLDINDVEIFEDSGANPRYLKFTMPNTTCGFTFDTTGETTFFGHVGPFGGSNWTAYVGGYCGGTAPDFTQDGDYIFEVYTSSDLDPSDLVNAGTWCQGDSCAPPPTPSGQTEATSTIEQTQQNLWNAYFAFIAIVWMVLWLGRGK